MQQVATLVHRIDIVVLKSLVITISCTGRWIIPKGWPQVGRTIAETALREAYEEAGIRGEVSPIPIGSFCYCKTDLPPERINQFVAAVFAVQFTGQEK